MGQAHPLPATPEHDDAPPLHGIMRAVDAAPLRPVPRTVCGLCGERLISGALRYRMISPQHCRTTITVCHLCRKAALGEGYRPVE